MDYAVGRRERHVQHVGQRVVVETSNDDPQRDSYLMEYLAEHHPETHARITAREAEPKPEPKPMVHVDLNDFTAQSVRRGGARRRNAATRSTLAFLTSLTLLLVSCADQETREQRFAKEEREYNHVAFCTGSRLPHQCGDLSRPLVTR